jgi:thioredoxin 1
MSDVLQLTQNDFQETIQNGVTLVDFWAPWCGPCKMQIPILDAVSAKAAQGVQVAKVNVDDNPEVAGQFGVQSIPTLIVFKDGQEVKRFTGITQEADLLEAVNNA